ncbi:MAG: amidohydrolase family protein [Phycisphaerales bacterium]
MSERELLLGGRLLLPDSGGLVRVGTGAVRVRAGRIEEVVEGAWPARPDLGGPGCLICPAFTDCHVHLPQFDAIGRGGMELLEWLERVVFPAEALWADADFAGAMAARVARQLLSFGTVGVAAYATVHHEGARRAIAALEEAGLRGHVGQVLMDRGAPRELLGEPGALLEQAAALRACGRISPAVTPRFALACTEGLLAGAGRLARDTGWLVQTHLSETHAECERVRELFGGVSYTEVYRRAGLLGERSVLGHGVWLDDAERRALAESGSLVAHCPGANRFLNSGAMSRAALARAGVRVCLGSDVAGGPDRSMVRVARAMVETAQALGEPPPGPAECWWQVTAGNAAAIGLADGGVLAPGAAADVLVIRPDIPWTADEAGLGALMWAWDDRWLAATLARGRAAYAGPRA